MFPIFSPYNGKERNLRPGSSIIYTGVVFLFLQTALKENRELTNIVVTHHVPTLQHYPVKYRNSPLNEAFAVELYDLIHDSGAAYWIYGHHHFNSIDFTIGSTTMLTNQLGYVHQKEHAGFKTNTCIEIN